MTDEVYPPSEDSLFLCKSVEGFQADRVAEVGVGSGFVLRHYVQTNSPNLALGTDVDLGALKVARERERADSAEFVLCQSCNGLRGGSMQLVFFNPPYLRDEGTADTAISGGLEGIQVTYEMACSSYRVLERGGRMVFIASNLSNIDLLLSRLTDEKMGARKLASLKLFFEELFAFEVIKDESVSRKPL